MALRFSGNQNDTDTGSYLEAFDGETRVIVHASTEAIQDYGLYAVRQKASEKYAAGLIEENGQVRTFTTDFAKAR